MGVVKSISEKSFTCCIVVSSQWGGAPTAREARACAVFTRVKRVIFHQLWTKKEAITSLSSKFIYNRRYEALQLLLQT